MPYFVRPVPGCAHSRYFLGHFAGKRFIVERTQISRPDGQQIAEPPHVAMPRATPPVLPPTHRVRPAVPSYHAPTGADGAERLAHSRARGAERGNRKRVAKVPA